MVDEKIKVFMRFAIDLANLSKCNEKHVACVLTNKKLDQVFSIGINGGPAKGPQCMCKAGTKESCTHAEINALIKNKSNDTYYAFCTLFPCNNCQIALANAGIKVIYYYNKWKSCEVIPQAPFVIRRLDKWF